MNDSIDALPSELGQVLSDLRNAVGLKQSDIAQELSLNASRISRIETGDTPPTLEEIDRYLSAIGTKDAEAYRKFLKHPWKQLNRPSFRHPQRDALQKADSYLEKLNNFISQPDVPGSLIAQAQMYRDSLLREADYLTPLTHSIAYIGDIGVGKTTVVCLQAGLVVPQTETTESSKIILETGAGGTTVCEVRVRCGSNFGIVVEPQIDTEIYRLVGELCAGLKENSRSDQDKQQKGVSREVNRTLRNMAGLVKKRQKSHEGRSEWFDPMEQLLAEYEQLDALESEISSRLKLWQRTRREIWLEETPKQIEKGLEWLKKTFEDINNGRHEEFSLPQQINVFIPREVLHDEFKFSGYELEIVDTKGVDQTAIRPDLKNCLDNPRTITVLCSRFNSAPDSSIQSLIEHLNEPLSKRALEERVILLVLPRSGEAVAMKDDSGFVAETEEDGYDLKHDQVKEQLQRIGVSGMPLYFFNAISDEPIPVTRAIIEQIKKLRLAQENRISEIANKIDYLIENQKAVHVLAAQRTVFNSLQRFVDQHQDLLSSRRPVYVYALSAVEKAHARTVWATTRRSGIWGNLDIYYYLGYGATAEAENRSQQVFSGLITLIEDKLGESDLEPVHDFLKELLVNWKLWRENFLESARRAGEQTFRPTLANSSIWVECEKWYGEGLEFRKKVADELRAWFESESQQYLLELLEKRISSAWREEVLKRLEKLSNNGIRTE